MYPKKPPSRVQSASSRKYLTQQQKNALKVQIADRLSKKFGIKYSDLIKDQIDLCMDQNNNLTSNVLQDLENNIQRITKKGKGNQNIDLEDEDEKSIKSGHSKMSGASNFDHMDTLTQQYLNKSKKGIDQESDPKKNKKLTTLNIVKPENDLDFLEEDNEWAAIFKYNRYLYEKEGELLKEKERKQKIKVKSDLDQQVKEKEVKVYKEKEENAKYSDNVLLQLERFDERERQKQDLEQQLRLQEKRARHRQIKENKYKRRHEDKQEKALDQFLMAKVREELDAEQRYLQFKKEHQRSVMQQLKTENDKKIEQQKQEEQQEKEDNIKLMQAYAKLIDDQDAERERTMKERDLKMKEFYLRSQVAIVQENEEKLKKMDARRDKYERRHEKKLDQIEEEKKMQIQQQKSDLKNYLFDQMDQKQTRAQTAKTDFYKQADIWKDDTEKYTEYEQQKKSEKQRVMNEYSQQLRQQIATREESKRLSKVKMNENETLLNKHLLMELDKVKDEINSRNY